MLVFIPISTQVSIWIYVLFVFLLCTLYNVQFYLQNLVPEIKYLEILAQNEHLREQKNVMIDSRAVKHSYLMTYSRLNDINNLNTYTAFIINIIILFKKSLSSIFHCIFILIVITHYSYISFCVCFRLVFRQQSTQWQ